MIPRTINSLSSMFTRKAKPMEEQLELGIDPALDLGGIPEHAEPINPPANWGDEVTLSEEPILANMVVTQLFIAGSGSDKPELHIINGTMIHVRPLTNPVTVAELAAILETLK